MSDHGHQGIIPKLLEKSKLLPPLPGCYLMKSATGQVLYVGKAKNLKNRVTSYFNNSFKSPKTEALVSHIIDFDFFLTSNEVEAFVLENNLIKKHWPKYNIRLKDNKSYPYVMVNLNDGYPRLEYVRNPKRGKNIILYGPFVSGGIVLEVVRVLTKNFMLRDCRLSEFKRRKEPCLLYQMQHCSAPCTGKISEEDYWKNLEMCMNVFEGKGENVVEYMEERMLACAEREEFEKAALIRDDSNVIRNFMTVSTQKNVEFSGEETDVDVVACYTGEIEVDVSFYLVRRGILLGHKHFYFSRLDFEDLSTMLLQYYSTTSEEMPKRIVSPLEKDECEIFGQALEKFIKQKIKVGTAGNKYKGLMELTYNHAREMQRVRLLQDESCFMGLEKLKELLQLQERPRVLECFDVAIWQGKSPTASRIVFRDGLPDKENYRYYHLQEREEGNNDFAMMKELFERRLKMLDYPDVFIVDGGLGQVNVAREVLKEMNAAVPVVGIAKARSEKETGERLIIPGRSNPYPLDKNKALMRLMVQMRDEAHRFSRKLHHKAESRRLFGDVNL